MIGEPPGKGRTQVGHAKAPNQKVILMPLETSSVIGSIAGIAERTKGVLTDQG